MQTRSDALWQCPVSAAHPLRDGNRSRRPGQKMKGKKLVRFGPRNPCHRLEAGECSSFLPPDAFTAGTNKHNQVRGHMQHLTRRGTRHKDQASGSVPSACELYHSTAVTPLVRKKKVSFIFCNRDHPRFSRQLTREVGVSRECEINGSVQHRWLQCGNLHR